MSERIECLDYHEGIWNGDLPPRLGECVGEVVYRESLTGTGTPIPRCDAHWQQRLERDDAHRRIYPDSPIAPSWFDPADAGERWDYDY